MTADDYSKFYDMLINDGKAPDGTEVVRVVLHGLNSDIDIFRLCTFPMCSLRCCQEKEIKRVGLETRLTQVGKIFARVPRRRQSDWISCMHVVSVLFHEMTHKIANSAISNYTHAKQVFNWNLRSLCRHWLILVTDIAHPIADLLSVFSVVIYSIVVSSRSNSM